MLSWNIKLYFNLSFFPLHHSVDNIYDCSCKQNISDLKLNIFVDKEKEYQCDAESTDFHKIARSVRPDPNFYEEGARYYKILKFNKS